jgi:hypothetical protein
MYNFVLKRLSICCTFKEMQGQIQCDIFATVGLLCFTQEMDVRASEVYKIAETHLENICTPNLSALYHYCLYFLFLWQRPGCIRQRSIFNITLSMLVFIYRNFLLLVCFYDSALFLLLESHEFLAVSGGTRFFQGSLQTSNKFRKEGDSYFLVSDISRVEHGKG